MEKGDAEGTSFIVINQKNDLSKEPTRRQLS